MRIVRILGGLVGVVALATVGFAIYLVSLNSDPTLKPERQMSEVWADFPFQSNYVEVKGTRMHYVDEGEPEGQVYLFLHGNPTSSYLWRKVIPSVTSAGGRAIALDNIGFGASDRPDIDYSFSDHLVYTEAFMDALALKDVILVVHDWGSAIGFSYMADYPDNVRGLVFMEAMVQIPSSADMPLPFKMVFEGFRTAGLGELMILGGNFFVEQAVPMNVLRTLKPEEHAAYREPFPSFGSRIPTLMAPREVPFDGQPEWIAQHIMKSVEWLSRSSHPKLLLYAQPGALIGPDLAEEIAASWRNTQSADVGPGLHYIQEDLGPEIGQAIVQWSSQVIQTDTQDHPLAM
ncbi:MAG: haloalkane dehalogenase [Pseudomonadota bacterium]